MSPVGISRGVVCAQCHREFQATRADAFYCTSHCRLVASRQRKRAGVSLPPKSARLPEPKTVAAAHAAPAQPTEAPAKPFLLNGPPTADVVCFQCGRRWFVPVAIMPALRLSAPRCPCGGQLSEDKAA